MYQLTQESPLRRGVHPQKMVAAGKKLLSEQTGRSVARDCTPLVEDLPDSLPVGKNDDVTWADLQREHTAILFRPSRQSTMSVRAFSRGRVQSPGSTYWRKDLLVGIWIMLPKSGTGGGPVRCQPSLLTCLGANKHSAAYHQACAGSFGRRWNKHKAEVARVYPQAPQTTTSWYLSELLHNSLDWKAQPKARWCARF